MQRHRGNPPHPGSKRQSGHLGDAEIDHLADWQGALERLLLQHALRCNGCRARLLAALAERFAADVATAAGPPSLSRLVSRIRDIDPDRLGHAAREWSFPERSSAMHPFHEAPPLATGGPIPITEKLKAERIQAGLAELPTWELRPSGDAIRRSWATPGLWCGTAFAGGLAAVVEQHGHEATIVVTPAQVRVTLTTPEANGLTEKDFEVAAALEFGA